MCNEECKYTSSCNNCESCGHEHTTQKTIDWSDMLEISCHHLGKWGVYANFTGDASHQAKLEELCAKFFRWCEDKQISQEDAHNFANSLLFGNAVLFDSSKQAGTIYRFFNEPGVYAGPWFACLVSPEQGIVEENT